MEFAAERIVIVGLGLIGGSIARGLRAAKPDLNLVAVDRNEAVLREAEADGVISRGALSLADCAADADLIIIAVPGLSMEEALKGLAGAVAEGAVITDVSSVKGAIVEAAIRVFGKAPANFVPGHPIAGAESSGYQASTAELYQGSKVILTPLENTSGAALQTVSSLWRALGAQVLTMAAERHDQVLAATSHLPHLLAYALVETLSRRGERDEIFRYAAGGFRDFTRIASSDPRMWHDIFLANGEAAVAVLDEYAEELQRLRKALVEKDSEELIGTFRRAKKSRDRFLALSRANPAPSDPAHDE